MRRSFVLLFALVALAAGFGLGWCFGPGPTPHYCAECAAILRLQARRDLSAIDRADLDRLKADLARKESGQAEWHQLQGEPPDLHPDCGCACHRWWLPGNTPGVHAKPTVMSFSAATSNLFFRLNFCMKVLSRGRS